MVFRSGWGKERSECFYIVIMLIPFVLVLGRMVGLKNCCNFSSFSFGLMLDALSSIKKFPLRCLLRHVCRYSIVLPCRSRKLEFMESVKFKLCNHLFQLTHQFKLKLSQSPISLPREVFCRRRPPSVINRLQVGNAIMTVKQMAFL